MNQKLNFPPNLMPMTPTQWPHTEPRLVVEMVLACPEAAITVPAFPRLEKLAVERMLQGMPCAVIDREHSKAYFDTSDPGRVEAELTAFYEHFLAEDLDHFAVPREASPGFYLSLDALRQGSWRGRFISVSQNGPISFGMRVMDQDGRPIFYHEQMRDAVIKTLVMKARWLYSALCQAAPGAIIGNRIAEPLLTLQGTAFASLPRADVLAAINEVLQATPGPTTVHCCANIDWPLLYESVTDIIHFDAFEFADKLCLYPQELQAYLDRGGMVAWGIVPANSDKLLGETVDSLIARFERGLAAWEAHGLDRRQVLEASFLQPSCSLSTMTEELAERAFRWTNEIAVQLQEMYSVG
ncbi:MAG: hypothetical protein HYY01_07395 [Chloroflexi bacterium]|nr:hypothetical protein [Chloroflexota bacterium]